MKLLALQKLLGKHCRCLQCPPDAATSGSDWQSLRVSSDARPLEMQQSVRELFSPLHLVSVLAFGLTYFKSQAGKLLNFFHYVSKAALASGL